MSHRDAVPDAVIVLESGRVLPGRAFGARDERVGEVVFNTAMVGYQEVVSDPSYAGQIVVMTAPQIGNTGVNEDDDEAGIPACAGLVVKELSPLASNWRSRGELDAYLRERGVAGIEGVDTRALTRAIREGGAQRGIIATGRAGEGAAAELAERVRSSPAMEGRDLVRDVTCAEPYGWDRPGWRGPGQAGDPLPADLHVVAYDFGIKRNILRELRDAGCRVTVLPAHVPAREALAMDADGFFLSNGPGDPAAVSYGVEAVKALIDSRRPVFGICLGHQILALAAGAETFKLPFGHHGANHPVQDLTTGKVEITSQNHGFSVAAGSLPRGVTCTHKNLYDDTVEGIRFEDRPVFGVQYHPEARPGPRDAGYLFGRFVRAMREHKRGIG